MGWLESAANLLRRDGNDGDSSSSGERKES
jgi:hypothetical protein